MSAKFRIESGSCYGRDFSTTDPVNVGMCSKFVDFLLRPNSSGASQVITTIDHTIDAFNLVGHGYDTGDIVVLMGGTLPAGFTLTTSIAHPLNMSSITPYYLIKVNNDRFRLASTRFNAFAGTYVTFSDNGSGTITVTKLGGGAQWNMVEDFSAEITKTFNPSDVNVAGNVITITDHGFPQHCKVVFSTTGGLPANITAGTPYWIYRIDKDSFYVHYDVGYAVKNINRVDIGSQGTGVHTIQQTERFMVFCDTVGAAVNDYDSSPSGMPPKFIRIGFLDSEPGFVRMHGMLWWDSSTHTPRGIWAGYKVATSDSATFAYDFRGGDECIYWSARLGSTWGHAFIDQWTGISSLLEPATTIGTVKTAATAGSNVVIDLNDGEAVLFSKDKFYYIYDFDGHTWVNYFKIVEDPITTPGSNSIKVSNINQNFPVGSVITPYAHRFYAHTLRGSNLYYSGDYFLSSFENTIPYCSSTNQDLVTPQQANPSSWGVNIHLAAALLWNDSILGVAIPDDELNYYGMRYLLGEYYSCAYTDRASMNRIYGKSNNWIRTYRNVMAQMLDYRIMGAKNWLMIDDAPASYVGCFMHSESTV